MRPLPIFHQLDFEPSATREANRFSAGEPLEIEFVAPGDNIDGIYWRDLIQNSRQNVTIRVVNLTKNVEVARLGTPEIGLGVETPSISSFSGNNDKGDRMRLTLTSTDPQPPRIYHTDLPLRDSEILTMIDGTLEDWTPLIYVGIRGKRNQPDLTHTFFDFTDYRLDDLRPSKGAAFTAMKRDHLVTIRCVSPVDDCDFLYLPDVKPSESANIRMRLVNESQENRLVDEWSTAKQGHLTRKLPPGIRKGDRLAVHFLWQSEPFIAMPEFADATTIPLTVREGGVPFKAVPRFLLHYDWPTRHLFWIWLAVPVLFVLAVRESRDSWVTALFLSSIGIAASMGSVLAWEQNYAHFAMQTDPDGYGAYAEALVGWVRDPAARGELQHWMRNYEHTHVALVPAVLALFMLTTPLSMMASYLTLSGIVSFGALVAMFYHMRHQLELSRMICLLMTALFAAHLMMHKAFARPSTDAMGSALIVFTFVALAGRWKRPTFPNSMAIAALIFLHALARPPGVTFAVPIFGLVVLGDYLRDRSVPLFTLNLKRLGIIVFPLLLIGLLYGCFDWVHNQQLALEKSKEFHAWANPINFFQSLTVAVLGVLPVIWLALFRKGAEKPHRFLILYFGWMLFYLALIVLVQAPFLLRLFLPVVASVVLITAVAIDRMSPRWRWISCGVVALLIAGNCAIIFYDISIPYLPPKVLAPYVY